MNDGGEMIVATKVEKALILFRFQKTKKNKKDMHSRHHL